MLKVITTAIDHRDNSTRVFKKVYTTNKKSAERIVKRQLKAFKSAHAVGIIPNDEKSHYLLHLYVTQPKNFDLGIDMDIAVVE